MPRPPILSRELFFEYLPDGSTRFLDFCLVNTELGAMIEPRSVNLVPASHKIVVNDLVDTSFTKVSYMSEDEFYKLTGFGGRQQFTGSKQA